MSPPLRALGEVVLGPVVVDRLPVLLRHHAVDGLEGGDGDAAGFGLEVVVSDDVELARSAPVVGAVGAHAGAGGGAGLIAARGLEFGHQLAEAVVDLLGREALVARAPQAMEGWLRKRRILSRTLAM